MNDQPYPLGLLREERLEPLTDWKLNRRGLARDLQNNIREILREKRRREACLELIQAAPLLDLLDATAALQPLALKGLDYRTRLYPPATRPAQDIDLYLERRKFGRFAEIAEKLGWRLITRGAFGRRLWRQWNHLVWIKDQTLLEVHYALTAPGRCNRRCKFGENPIPLDLHGVTLWVPQKEDAALFALVHLCGNHIFDPHILSVYDIWLLSPGLDWGKLYTLARRAGLERTVSFALAYLRNYPTLKKLLPPGEPFKPDRIGSRFLRQEPRRVQLRSRLLGLYLIDPPIRALTYVLDHLWSKLNPL
ncbi:nucleotidyltransferase family protein [bacterium]|nr:nucleotidyltransferase family protein [bacterium]